MADAVTLDDIVRARQRLRPHVEATPLEQAPQLGDKIWLKLENANKTGSFKIRGALNAVLSLDAAARDKGIIAVSSGNHAGAVAFAAHATGAAAQILMPVTTPQKKVDNVRRYGAEALLVGDTYDQAEAEALRRVSDGGAWISPYNDPHVIAGAGTIGLEIMEQLASVERVVVPVSGGGLIAGVALALKQLQPHVEVIGVNARSAPAMYNVFNDTKLPQQWDTLADALSGDIEPGSITLPIARRFVDEMALVTEEEIASAMRFMHETGDWVVEGGGAVAVAAQLHEVLPRDGRATALVVSGGNVDADVLRRALLA